MPNPIKNRFTMPRPSDPAYRVEQRGRVYCVTSGKSVGARWTRQEAEDAAAGMNGWHEAQAERKGA